MRLMSTYFWPSSSAGGPDVDEEVAALVQPVVDDATRVMRMQHQVVSSSFVGGTRAVSQLRAALDKAFTRVIRTAVTMDGPLTSALEHLRTQILLLEHETDRARAQEVVWAQQQRSLERSDTKPVTRAPPPMRRIVV